MISEKQKNVKRTLNPVQQQRYTMERDTWRGILGHMDRHIVVQEINNVEPNQMEIKLDI